MLGTILFTFSLWYLLSMNKHRPVMSQVRPQGYKYHRPLWTSKFLHSSISAIAPGPCQGAGPGTLPLLMALSRNTASSRVWPMVGVAVGEG